ncbi:hypothetical protein C032_01494 [Brucella abortus 63/294]|nr:hypothetical protein C032_01494 [Brucella abortus 63/294]ERU08453.1 hypothetical protein P039_00979 [Brucella abortus 07-0994-2411]
MVKRIRNRKQALLIAALPLLVFCGPPQAMAQDVSAARPAVLPLPGEAEGASIGSISVRLRQSSGNAERDAAAQEAARRITKSLDGLRLHKDERFGCVIIAIAKKRQRRPIA